MLNMIYDNTNWQEKTAFKTKISNLEDKFQIQINIRKKEYQENTIFCIVNSPLNIKNNKSDYFVRWHKISSIYDNDNIISLNFQFNETFSKCGYYDWNIVK